MKAPKLQPALLGGLFIGVLSALPFLNVANCCCLWLVVGGALAAYVMQQNHPLPVTLGEGAAVGMAAGVIGFVVMLIASIPVGMMTGPDMQRLPFGNLGNEGMSPEVSEMMRQVGPGVLAFIGGVLFLCVGTVASTIGGIAGAALFRKSSPPSGWGSASSDVPPAGLAPMPSGWAPTSPPPPLPPPPARAPDETSLAQSSLDAPAPEPPAPDDQGGPRGPWTGKPGSGDPS